MLKFRQDESDYKISNKTKYISILSKKFLKFVI